MEIKSNQLVTLKNNETGELRTGRVQTYSPDTILLTVRFNAKKWHFVNYENVIKGTALGETKS